MAGRSATRSTIPFGNTSRCTAGAGVAGGVATSRIRTASTAGAIRLTRTWPSPSSLGQQRADVLQVGREPALGHALEIRGGESADALEEFVFLRVSAEQLEARQQRGPAGDRVFLEDEPGLGLILGARELLVGHRLVAKPLHLREQLLLEGLRRLAGQRRGIEPEDVGIEREVRVVAPGVERELALVHEVAVETRRAPAAEHGREQLQCGRV